MNRIRSFAGALAHDQRGMGLIEITAIAPFLALLAVGVIDLSGAVTKKMKLHYAVHHTLELVSAHGLEVARNDNEYDFSWYRQKAADAAAVPLANVTVNVWLECSGVKKTLFADTCNPGQRTARYMRVRAISTFAPIFSIRTLGGAVGSTYSLAAESAVRIQ